MKENWNIYKSGLLIILASLSLTTGCSFSGLTNSRAAAIVKSDASFVKPVVLAEQSDIALKYVELNDEPLSIIKLDELQKYRAEHPDAAKAERASYLNIISNDVDLEAQNKARPTYLFMQFKTVLTPRGQNLARRYKLENQLPIARREVVEITDIDENDEGQADVKFKYKEIPIEVGKLFTFGDTSRNASQGEVKEGSAWMMNLNEQGWDALLVTF